MKNKLFFVIFALFFLGIQSWYLHVNLKYNYQEISVSKSSGGEWIITGFQSFAGPLKERLFVGDKILRIDDTEPDRYSSVRRWRMIDQSHTITVARGGTLTTVNTYEIQNTGIFDIVSAVGELLSMGFSLLLFLKLKGSKSGLYLSGVFFTIAWIFASLGPSIRGDATGKLFLFSALMMLPVVFMHFLKVFFEERGSAFIAKAPVYALYCGVFIAFALQMSYYFDSLAYAVFRYYSLTIVYFSIGLAIVFWKLFSIYFRYRKDDPYLALVIQTILVSLFISFFPFVAFSFAPQLLLGHDIISSIYTGWFVLFFPTIFAYLIVSKQLYDIDIVVRRAVYTIVVSLIPSAVLAGINALIADRSLHFLLISFFVTLMVMSLVLYSLEYVTTRLEKIMFPRKYYLQAALKKIAKKLSTVTSFREMKDLILVDIVTTMQVHGGAIVFRYPDGMESIGEGTIDVQEVQRLLEEHKLMGDDRYRCFEINSHEEYTSYFVMTRKKTNSLLNREEAQWLNLIISYLAVSLENVYLIRKLNMKVHEVASQLSEEQNWQNLMWLRKTMFELQEKERVRISNDLHDTTMQDIFFVIRKLKSFLKLLPSVELQRQASDIITHLELVNTNLRQCCYELNPYLIQNVGLIGALTNLIDIEAATASFELAFRADGDSRVEKLDLETKRHLFRVVQELLNNAKKHSGASFVGVSICVAEGMVRIDYEDNGVGFTIGTATASVKDVRKRGGFGIEQMKTRIIHIGGEFELQAAVGAGMKATVNIPLKEAASA